MGSRLHRKFTDDQVKIVLDQYDKRSIATGVRVIGM